MGVIKYRLVLEVNEDTVKLNCQVTLTSECEGLSKGAHHFVVVTCEFPNYLREIWRRAVAIWDGEGKIGMRRSCGG